MTSSRPVKLVAVLVVSVLFICSGATACGRSAPDDGVVAAPSTGSQDERPTDLSTAETVVDVPSTDQMAGVRVVSEAQLVTATTAATAATVPQATASTTAAVTAASAYVVEPGDTLSVIAERFNVPLSDLTQANGIGDADTIKPGQKLVIPVSG